MQLVIVHFLQLLWFGVVPALPCPALPCPALPCSALPCSALPCPALPCPALPCPDTQPGPNPAQPGPDLISILPNLVFTCC